MTAPRSSLVSLFLLPSFIDLCLHVDEHDDLAIAVLAGVVKGPLAILLRLFRNHLLLKGGANGRNN